MRRTWSTGMVVESKVTSKGYHNFIRFDFFWYMKAENEQTLLIIKDLLEHDDKLADRTLASPRQILDLLDILLRTTCFKFNGDFYQQTDGTTMGGPTSAIVSEICMQSSETTAITTADHPPKIWERNVDDVF